MQQTDPARSGYAATGIFVALAALSLLPAIVTPIPAMVDYANHLARMYLLAAGGGPDANPFYETAWALTPNLAMDLIVPPLARLIGVEAATRLFLLLSQLLLIGGALALERVAKGRVEWAGFAAILFLHCLPFSWGFLNFEFGLGLMLLCAAGSLAWIERGWIVRLAMHAVFVGILFVAHFFALGLYGVTLGICELCRAHDRGLAPRDAALRLLVLAAPALALAVAVKATSGAIGAEGTIWGLEFKALWPFRILNGYNLTIASIGGAALIGFLALSFKHRLIAMTKTGGWLALAFGLLYLLIPSRVLGTSFADLRMLPAAALILAAFSSVAFPNAQRRRAALALVAGVTLANLAVVFWVWSSYRADYAAMIRSFDRLDRGAFVLTASGADEGDPPFDDLMQYPMWYGPTLAVHYAQAFVPNLYTEIGKQPLQVRAAYRNLAMPTAGIVPLRILAAIAAGQTPPGIPSAIADWRRDFQYLYVVGPHAPNPLPGILAELTRSPRFVLYKIVRSP